MSKIIIDIVYYFLEAAAFWLFCYKAFQPKSKVISASVTLVMYALLFWVFQFGNVYLNIA